MARPTQFVAGKPARRRPHVTTEVVALPIAAFCRAYSIGPSTVWKALREGRLKSVQIGRRRLVLLSSVQEAMPRAGVRGRIETKDYPAIV